MTAEDVTRLALQAVFVMFEYVHLRDRTAHRRGRTPMNDAPENRVTSFARLYTSTMDTSDMRSRTYD